MIMTHSPILTLKLEYCTLKENFKFHSEESKLSYISCYLDRELELVIHFRHQEIMAQSLPHLHDPYDGGINLILTILKDPFRGAGLLLHLQGKPV